MEQRKHQIIGYEEFERIARRIVSDRRINPAEWTGEVIREYKFEYIQVKGKDPRTFQRRQGDRRND